MPAPPLEPSDYRPAGVLLLLIGTVLVGGLLGTFLGSAVARGMGVAVAAISQSTESLTLSLAERNAIRWFNLLAHVGGFTLGSLLTAWVAFRGRWRQGLHLHTWPTPAGLLYLPVLLLGGFLLMQLVYWFNQQLPLPDSLWEMENQQNWLVEQVLRMESPWEFALTLLVAGIAPAVGEELLFRGLVQPQLRRWTGSVHWAVWIAAILFSAIHLQFAGFIPRMLLGALLGYLLVWTHSLWAPILAHFLFNGVQIVVFYFFREEFDPGEAPQLEPAMVLSALAGAVLLAWAARQLIQDSRRRHDPA